jgi:hypothetical protein
MMKRAYNLATFVSLESESASTVAQIKGSDPLKLRQEAHSLIKAWMSKLSNPGENDVFAEAFSVFATVAGINIESSEKVGVVKSLLARVKTDTWEENRFSGMFEKFDELKTLTQTPFMLEVCVHP